MRRLLSLFACMAVTLGGSIVTGTSAHADDGGAAYCPYGSVTGQGFWSPAVTATLEAHSFEWITDAYCTGSADEGGYYGIDFHFGQSFESCAAGSGVGAIDGTGPEGSVSGTFGFYRVGVHLIINGEFMSAGEWHKLGYWLDVLPQLPDEAVCNYTDASLIGHGAIADDPLPIQ